MTATTPPPPTATLDEAALAKLRELDPDDRQDVFGRVMRTYETSLAQALEQFRSLAAAGDADGVRQLAHKMKASSAAVGALDFANACTDLERRLRAGPVPDFDDEVARLSALASAALAAVRAMLQSR